MGKASVQECYLAALKKLVEKRGTQAKLARFLGKEPPYVNDLLRGRRNISVSLQEQIAAYFKMNPEDMIRMGRDILEGKSDKPEEPPLPFQDELDQVGHNNSLAAHLIYKRVGLEFNMLGLSNALMENLGIFPPGWEDYVNGKLTSYEFYELVKEHIQASVARLRK